MLDKRTGRADEVSSSTRALHCSRREAEMYIHGELGDLPEDAEQGSNGKLYFEARVLVVQQRHRGAMHTRISRSQRMLKPPAAL